MDIISRNWKSLGLLAAAVALVAFLLSHVGTSEPVRERPRASLAPEQGTPVVPVPPPAAPPKGASAPVSPPPAREGLEAGLTQPAPQDRPATEHFIPPDPNNMPAYWRNEDPEDPPLDLTHRPTPKWRLGKTEEALVIVTERAERTEREAAEAERAGRAEEAALKKEKAAMLRHKIQLIQADLEIIRGEVVREALAGGEPR